MNIENKQGVFSPDAKEPEKIENGNVELKDKFALANEKLQDKQVMERSKKNDFIEKFGLEEINGFEQLTDDHINYLMEFVERKTQLTEDEEEILKNVVIEKAKKIIAETINKDA